MSEETGSILITTILILLLITVTCLSTARISTMERQISTNALLYQRTCFAAESGIEHARKLIETPFVKANTNILYSGNTASWTFALDGSLKNIKPANDPDGNEFGEYDPEYQGAVLIVDHYIGGIKYTVSLWNNNDSGTYQNDMDGLIWLRSDAVDSRGTRTSIQVLLHGSLYGSQSGEHTAQAGGGVYNANNSNDKNAMNDFSQQISLAN